MSLVSDMAGLGVDGTEATFVGLEYRVDNIPVFKVVCLKGRRNWEMSGKRCGSARRCCGSGARRRQ